MTTAIDGNILFDVLFDADPFASASTQALTQAAAEGPTVVSPIVYAELAAYFAAPAELDAFLGAVGVRIDDLPEAARFAAGGASTAYSVARQQQLACAACGQSFALACPTCAAEYQPRQHVRCAWKRTRRSSPDQGWGYVRRYFPDLKIVVLYVR